LHGDLDASPDQEGIKNIPEPVLNKLFNAFLLQACPQKNARYDKKEWHPETKKENIKELQHGMFIYEEYIGIG